MDLTFKTGASVGTITYSDENQNEITGVFGGVPLNVMWNRGYNNRVSIVAGGGVLLDLVNSQLVKQGFVGGASWHLLGGAREYGHQGEVVSYSTRSSSSLSLLTLGGLQNYAATDADDPRVKVAGSVFEASTGFEYRKDFTDTHSGTIDIVATVFTLPASTSRIRPRTLDILFGWRSFF